MSSSFGLFQLFSLKPSVAKTSELAGIVHSRDEFLCDRTLSKSWGCCCSQTWSSESEGERRGEEKGRQQEKRLSSETSLLSITKYFPLEENTWPWLSTKSYYLPIIENVLVIHAWTFILSGVRGMAGRSRMEIEKLFDSTFLQLIYCGLVHII